MGGSAPTPTTTTWRRFAQRHGGDRVALAELVARCVPALRRWAHGRLPRWARTCHDTVDFVQDAVWHTILRCDGVDLRSRRVLAAYLRTAVRNRLRDEHRRLAVRRRAEELPASLTDHSPSPLDRLVTEEEQRRYRDALARLRPRDRALIVAHVELEYTHEQLACMIGRTPHAARMALRRAVARLAERMRDG